MLMLIVLVQVDLLFSRDLADHHNRSRQSSVSLVVILCMILRYYPSRLIYCRVQNSLNTRSRDLATQKGA